MNALDSLLQAKLHIPAEMGYGSRGAGEQQLTPPAAYESQLTLARLINCRWRHSPQRGSHFRG